MERLVLLQKDQPKHGLSREKIRVVRGDLQIDRSKFQKIFYA